MFYPGGLGQVDPSAIDATIADWQRTLDGLNAALVQARQSGNADMEAQVRSGIKAVLLKLIELGNAAHAQDMPSDVMMTLSAFSDSAIAAAKDVGGIADSLLKSTDDAVKGAAKSLNYLPLAVMALIAVIGIGFYKGSLSAKVSPLG